MIKGKRQLASSFRGAAKRSTAHGSIASQASKALLWVTP